jgi:hypothetical protein
MYMLLQRGSVFFPSQLIALILKAIIVSYSFLCYPLCIVKSRMQGLDAHKYKSTIHCVTELLRNEGPLAFYKGVGPRLTRVCLEVGITMSLYGEIVKVVSIIIIIHSICLSPLFSLSTVSFMP